MVLDDTVFKLMPEWQASNAVLLAWPFKDSDWRDTFDDVEACYWGILGKLLSRCHVLVLLHPMSSKSDWLRKAKERADRGSRQINVIDLDDMTASQRSRWYEQRGTATVSVDCALTASMLYDDTWIRDYGPLSGKNSNGSSVWIDFRFNGWGGKYPAIHDDQLTIKLANFLGQSCIQKKRVLEGGAIDLDGNGQLLVNRDCINTMSRGWTRSWDQSEKWLKNNLHCTTIESIEDIGLSNDDTDGHIDTMLRFLPGNYMAVSGRNAAHHDAPRLEDLWQQATIIAKKLGYHLIELPTPIVLSMQDERPLPATYANFLCVQDTIFLPYYQVEEDAVAQETLLKALPKFSIKGIDSLALVEQHGSLHCATMNIG